MRNDAIYLISDSGALQRVEHQLYASEDILQQLVAKHPEVLAGDQIDPEAPPRWLLLGREARIPDSASGEDRWWLDHLLLDQFGVPTLVEVKRSTDTRIRREVVGQMLDYVANAQAYWAAGRMRQMLVDECGSPELASSHLIEHLRLDDQLEGTTEAIDRFWNKVEANLREGNVRLLFVADELPRELRRLIEFLNEQFTKIEVLGVERRQYVGQGVRALVPRVVGQTEAAREQKERSSPSRSGRSTTTTDRATFLASTGPEAAELFSKIFEEAGSRGLQISFGSKGFSLRAPKRPAFFYGYPPGANGRGTSEIELFFRDLSDPKLAEQMRASFAGIPYVTAAGKFTLRIPVAGPTMKESQRVVSNALEFMEQQRADSGMAI